MPPTGTLAMMPVTGPTGIGTLIGIVAVGALVVLLVGFLLQRREAKAVAIDLPQDGDSANRPASRLSA